MKLNQAQTELFINMFIHQKTTDYACLLERIFELRYRFDNIDKQEWYFRKGIESQKRQMQKMKEEYTSLVHYLNTHTLSELKSEIEKKQARLELFLNSKHVNRGFMYHLAKGSLSSKLSHAKMMVKTKNKLPFLPTWDDLDEPYSNWKSSYKERKFILEITSLFKETIDPRYLLQAIKDGIHNENSVVQNLTNYPNVSEAYRFKIENLSDSEKKLLNNIDMIFFYVWDLARIHYNDDMRDEYISYSFVLFEILTSTQYNAEKVSNYLFSMEEDIILYPKLDQLTRNTFSLFLCSLKDIS